MDALGVRCGGGGEVEWNEEYWAYRRESVYKRNGQGGEVAASKQAKGNDIDMKG